MSHESSPRMGDRPIDRPAELLALPDDLERADDRAVRLRSRLSIGLSVLAVALVAATFLLISPPDKAEYPGVIPWSPGSPLKALTDAMSLGDAFATARGVEIKDVAFHFAAAIGLALLAARALISGLVPPQRRTAKGAWFHAQVLLVGWIALSAASALWAPDAAGALGQATIFGFLVAWAISVAWTLEGKDVPRVCWGYVVAAAVASGICVWYFYARNPANRPGFPIGNPSSLAASILPALVIAAAVAVGSAGQLARDRTNRDAWKRLAGAVICWIPLVWCFKLADSRGAYLGAALGVAGLLFLLSRERLRRWIVFGAFVAAAGLVAWLSTYNQDIAMGRGDTIRFRVYAWQYAAILWGRRPITGNGAGSFPQLSGLFTDYSRDRALDPAAFMGEAVEHAHNELFEVFTEIGLVGGLTFVGGFVATLIAASGLLQANHSPERRWLILGLVAGFIALMADALFGVSLRLPGVPAIFATLLGVLWALCRSVSKRRDPDGGSRQWFKRMVLRRYLVAAAAGVLAIIVGVVAFTNARGLRFEYAAFERLKVGDAAAAVEHAERAESLLLDPVRRLIVIAESQIPARLALASNAYSEFTAVRQNQPASSPVAAADLEARRAEAIRRCREAFEAAADLERRAPTFGRPAAVQARCAEVLAELYREIDVRESLQWASTAWNAWVDNQFSHRYDPQTLLSLCRYMYSVDPFPAGAFTGLLRDTLRAGAPPRDWYDWLRRGLAKPGFRETVEAMAAAAGPYTPTSELDALILSGAPEAYRLRAAIRAAEGDYAGALEDTNRALALYQPMRTRFPALPMVALGEQAEYTFRRDPLNPQVAIEIVRKAIDAAPRIQAQKRLAMQQPYWANLARYELARRDEAAADRALATFISDGAERARILLSIRTRLLEEVPSLQP